MAQVVGLWQQPLQTRVQRAVLHRPATWQSAPVPTVGKVWASLPDMCLLSRQCQRSKGFWVLAAVNMEKARGPPMGCGLHSRLGGVGSGPNSSTWLWDVLSRALL